MRTALIIIVRPTNCDYCLFLSSAGSTSRRPMMLGWSVMVTQASYCNDTAANDYEDIIVTINLFAVRGDASRVRNYTLTYFDGRNIIQ